VQPGPASRSYGIQVAQLAGVPAAVLREARIRLQLLEANAAAGVSPQAGLFDGQRFLQLDGVSEQNGAAKALVDDAARALEQLRGVEADALTPRDALALIYQLKQTLGGQE
jgi:DNA mismatch repair protein MutS